MEIKNFIKEGKNMVIEIDEVEYLVDDKAIEAITKQDPKVPLIQLYDRQVYFIDLKDIENSFLKNGVIDYLDKTYK